MCIRDSSYGDQKIIDDVSFTIPEGTTTAIVGPSGSGKTTLTSLMAVSYTHLDVYKRQSLVPPGAGSPPPASWLPGSGTSPAGRCF